jgi:plasmid maintenance system antidote protein VapI
VRTLIDRARELVPTDAALARILNMKPPNLVEAKTGKRHLTAEQIARLCDLLRLSGEEARMWLAQSAIERAQDSSARSLMAKAFFTWWGLGVVCALITTAPNDASAGQARTGGIDGLYIVAHWLRQWARTVRRLLRVCDPPLRGSPC